MYLETVAGHHDAQNILTDIMHISLHRSNHHHLLVARQAGGIDATAGLIQTTARLIHIRRKNLHSIPHHFSRLDNLRQKHLALAEQLADMLHAIHKRSLDHLHSLSIDLHRLLDVLLQPLSLALHNGLVEPLLKRLLLHSSSTCLSSCSRSLSLLRGHHLSRLCNQPLSSLRILIENHILDALEQLRLDIVIYLKHRRIDDSHIHSSLDRVI